MAEPSNSENLETTSAEAAAPEVAARLEGYRQALTAAGIARSPHLEVAVRFGSDTAYHATASLIDAEVEFDGIVACSDVFAMSAMRALVDGKARSKPNANGVLITQAGSVFPWLTVRENLLFGLDDARPDREALAKEYAELVGLQGFENHYPHELSGGMLKRAEMARAMPVYAGVERLERQIEPMTMYSVGRIQRDLRGSSNIGAIATAVVAYLQFGTAAMAVYVSGISLVITSIEGWLLTPWLTSRTARTNEVAIFIALIFWSFVWGIWGTLLAVPMLVAVKAYCDRIEDLKPVGELLGE